MSPRKKKDTAAVDPSLPPIPKELLDQLVTGPMTAEAVEAVMRQFKKAFIERALGAEMTHHLGYQPGGDKPEGAANHRNGSSAKTVLTDDGRCASTCRVTGMAPSNRSSSASTNAVSPALTTRSSPCMHAA